MQSARQVVQSGGWVLIATLRSKIVFPQGIFLTFLNASFYLHISLLKCAHKHTTPSHTHGANNEVQMRFLFAVVCTMHSQRGGFLYM